MKLSQVIDQYVTLKQSLGNKFKTSDYYLRAFSCLAGVDADITDITAEQIKGFLVTSQQITRTWHEKYKILHGFYTYAISRGYVRSSLLPTIKPKLPQPFVPYIYTHDEIRRLFAPTTIFS